MPPFLRFLFRSLIVFALIVFVIQPFNWFCQITQKCRPFYFSYYIPKINGDIPIDVILEVMNYHESLEFFSEEPALVTVTNKKNIVTYHAKNLSNKTITFRPKLIVEPDYFEQYLIRYECLCFRSYRLKAGEEIILKMEFEIDRKIEETKAFKKQQNKTIKIRYKV